MSSLKVFVEDGDRMYESMFLANGWQVTDKPEEADLVQFVGGADVSPSLYNEEAHPTTWFDSITDMESMYLYNLAIEENIPMAGICRGSQFLCVMGGGKLWQDVDGHATGHTHSLVDIPTGIVIEECSSTHHQQHRPADNAIIIARSLENLSTIKENGEESFLISDLEPTGDYALEYDVEAFYYKHINALGYQPHPEFFRPEDPCQKYYFDIIAKYLKLRGDV